MQALASQFDWLVRGTAGGSTDVWHLHTGIKTMSGVEPRIAILHIMDTIQPNTAPNESFPVLRICLQGILDCLTRAIVFNRSCVVDGLGSAVIRRAANYTLDSDAAVLVNTSNVTLKNFKIEDIIMNTTGYYDDVAGTHSYGIKVSPAAPGVENITFENLWIKNFVHHNLNISLTVPRYAKNITIRRCFLDNTLRGSNMDLRLGTTNVTVENCMIVGSGHNTFDLSGVSPPVRVIGNTIIKNNGWGPGMAMVTVAERTADSGFAEEIIIRDNYIYTNETEDTGNPFNGGGPFEGIVQSGIQVSGEARKIIIENNYIHGVGESGISVKSFLVWRDDETVTTDDYDAYSGEVIIRGNRIENTYSAAIIVTLDPARPYDTMIVTDNVIKNLRGPYGINLNSDCKHTIVANNHIYNINARQVANSAAIRMRISSPDTLVFGNHIIQPTATSANLTHAILEETGGGTTPTNRTFATNNHIFPSGKPITFIGADSNMSQNQGFKTENWGTATVASGATTATVTHGLNYTPSTRDIIIRPSGSMGSATKFWASSPGASNFTINVDTSPGGAGANFVWRVIRRR